MQIPMTLEFKSVAPNAKIVIGFPGPDVFWSIGETGRGSLGFSMNALVPENPVLPYIAQIELWGGELIVTTRDAGAVPDFDLTVFLDVPSNAWLLDGNLIANRETRILASVGCAQPVEWRSGRINAVIPAIRLDHRFVTFEIDGMLVGKGVNISLAKEGTRNIYSWAMGPASGEVCGFNVRSLTEEKIPLSALWITPTDVYVVTSADSETDGTALSALEIQLCVRRWSQSATSSSDKEQLLIKGEYDIDLNVLARVGNNQPRRLTNAFSPFLF